AGVGVLRWPGDCAGLRLSHARRQRGAVAARRAAVSAAVLPGLARPLRTRAVRVHAGAVRERRGASVVRPAPRGCGVDSAGRRAPAIPRERRVSVRRHGRRVLLRSAAARRGAWAAGRPLVVLHRHHPHVLGRVVAVRRAFEWRRRPARRDASSAMVDSAWSNESWLRPMLGELLGQEPVASLATDGRSLWEAAVAAGFVSDDRLVALAASRFGVPVADVARGSANARALLPERWARRFRVLPLRAEDGALEVATSDPLNLDCERALGFATGRAIRFALASPATIARALDAAYREEQGSPRLDVQHLSADVETAPPADNDDSASITRLVDDVLAEGIAARASDIHIEAEERGIVVRHRIDGMLRSVRTMPRSVAPSLVSRLKILCGLDIADRLRPQDGRARVAVNGVAVDLRVSTLPASYGEKVVIRVLDGRSTVLTLDGMGFLPDELERIERLLQFREGLILVTGPTGSGKTTTLYAALRRLKDRGVNIVTVEDPIEYRLPGIVQVQVNEKAGLTFATALRSIMRQDPDVVLIGEIRDRESRR